MVSRTRSSAITVREHGPARHPDHLGDRIYDLAALDLGRGDRPRRCVRSDGLRSSPVLQYLFHRKQGRPFRQRNPGYFLGGTLFNLVLGLAFLALLRMIGPGAPAKRYYVLWFGSMVNLGARPVTLPPAPRDRREHHPVRQRAPQSGSRSRHLLVHRETLPGNRRLGTSPVVRRRREGGACAGHRAKPHLVDRGGPRRAGRRSGRDPESRGRLQQNSSHAPANDPDGMSHPAPAPYWPKQG